MEDLKHAIYALESKFGKDIPLRRFYNAKALEAGGRHRKRKESKTSTLARRMKECENDEHIDECKSEAVCDLSRKGKHGLQAANKCCGRIAKAKNGKWYRSMRKKNLKRPCRWIEIENPNRKNSEFDKQMSQMKCEENTFEKWYNECKSDAICFSSPVGKYGLPSADKCCGQKLLPWKTKHRLPFRSTRKHGKGPCRWTEEPYYEIDPEYRFFPYTRG